MGASLAWLLVAPAYAWTLAIVARLAAPVLEKTGPMRYEVSGSRVHVIQPVPGERYLVHTAWTASQNFGVPLLVALIVATPGWTWRRRGRALAWGLGFLTLTQVAFMLVTIWVSLQTPTLTPSGYLPGHLLWLYRFFLVMGRGFFVLLIYFGLIATIGPPLRLAPGTAGPNDPCPCGSRRKFKRCCGAIRR